MDKEYKNYLKCAFWKPHWLLIFVIKYSLIFYNNFKRRTQRTKHFINDKEIDGFIKDIYPIISKKEPNIISFSRSWIEPSFKQSNINKLNLVLADGSIFDYKKEIDWEYPFTDAEMTYTLNRWGWIWETICKEKVLPNFQETDRIISDWSAKLIKNPDSYIWEPYSCAERISNYLMFYVYSGKKDIPQQILDCLKKNAFILLNNLEYKKGTKFFNHLLNNARGLYIYGILIGNTDLAEVGKKIIKKYFDKIINKDGFNREGSSHYQFVFTRWFIEVYLIAQLSSDGLDLFLKERVSRMILACSFYTVIDNQNKKIQIPLFGDISPDFNPVFLFHFIFTQYATSIIDKNLKYRQNILQDLSFYFSKENEYFDIAKSFRESQQESVIESSNKSWLRINYHKTTLFFHINKNGLNDYPSHEHLDTGSFALFLDGNEFIMDVGRLNYRNTSEGKFGISGKSHNGIIIDNFEPFVYSGKNKFFLKYRLCNCNYQICETENTNQLKFELNVNGYKRLYGDNISIKRIFAISKDHLIISDQLNGEKTHVVDTIFNLGPTFNIVKSSDFEFEIFNQVNGEKTHLQITPDRKSAGGGIFSLTIHPNFYSKYYGHLGSWNQLRIHDNALLPIVTQYKFSIIN